MINSPHTLYEALNIFIAMTAVTIELTLYHTHFSRKKEAMKKSRRWMCEVMLTRDVSNHRNFILQREEARRQ